MVAAAGLLCIKTIAWSMEGRGTDLEKSGQSSYAPRLPPSPDRRGLRRDQETMLLELHITTPNSYKCPCIESCTVMHPNPRLDLRHCIPKILNVLYSSSRAGCSVIYGWSALCHSQIPSYRDRATDDTGSVRHLPSSDTHGFLSERSRWYNPGTALNARRFNPICPA